MSSLDKDAFIRCHEALHLVCSSAAPCIQHVIQTWHYQQRIGACTNPNQCPTKVKGKPKPPRSCQSCSGWGSALETVEYINQPHAIFSSIAWSNINPTRLFHDPVEVAKAFGIRFPKGQQPPSTFDEFDTASLLLMMMKFGEFHHRDLPSYLILKKVSALRNFLSHMKLMDKLHIGDPTLKSNFQDIVDLVDCLQRLHSNYFTATLVSDIKVQLNDVLSAPITAKMRDEALKPLTDAMKDVVYKKMEEQFKQFTPNISSSVAASVSNVNIDLKQEIMHGVQEGFQDQAQTILGGFQQTSHAYHDHQQTQMAAVEGLHTKMDTFQLGSEQGNQNVQQTMQDLGLQLEQGFQQTSHAYHDHQQTQMASVEGLHTRMDTLQLTSEQGNQNVQQIIKHLPLSKDQEHEETITHWKDSLAKKYSQYQQKIRFGNSSRTVADMDDIFVDLTLWQNNEESQTELNSNDKGKARQRFGTGNEINEGRKGTKLQSCEDLLTLKSAKGSSVDHLILHGPAGSGKTTLISKMAYKWATNVAIVAPIETSSKREKSEWSEFQIVFLLEIKRLNSESCLEEVIQKQLLPWVSVERIAYAISKLGTRCLILFDGYDEMQKDVNIEIFNSPLLSQCFVILTTRAHKIGQITMDPAKSGYARVEISGFDSENAHKYIQKFFNKLRQPELGNTLIQKLDVTPMLKTLSAFPILLVMMCLLWENSHKHGIQFKTMTGLYQQAMIYLNRPFQHVSKTVTFDMITTILLKLGKPALDSLLDNCLQIRSDKFVHKEALRQSFEIGLTTQEEGNLIDEFYVSFIQKNFPRVLCSILFELFGRNRF